MYISYNWLNDFIKLPKSYSPEKLAEDLTLHTVEVEGIFDLSKKYDSVLVGEVLEVKKHPQADKLNLALVNIGQKEPLKIVCGASNLEAKQKVAVATIGSKLPNGLEILEAKIRGEISQGMICAEDELGLGSDHQGIMVLDNKAKPGMSLAKHLSLDDVVIEIDNKSLSNRPDLWGHYGIARELGVILDTDLLPYDKLLNISNNKNRQEISEKAGDNKGISVKIEDENLCPYYSAVKIKNIKIGESPDWIKQRLLAAGLNPINNIVDITNYVMLELGQPLHAFDASLINDIVIKPLKQADKFLALDNKEYELSKGDLVISSNKKTLAIAGVIGGKDSGIKEDTQEIILESANFDAVYVRKTSQRLGLRTEASSRFEKSLDPVLCNLARQRAINLILEQNSEALVEGGVISSGNNKLEEINIELSLAWLKKAIGQEVEDEYIKTVLSRLGFIVETKEDKDSLKLQVPSWRATKDVSLAEDILEEISRIYGYNKIVKDLPFTKISVPVFSDNYSVEKELKDSLAKDAGFSEVHSHVFVNSRQLNKLGISHSHYLSVKNPFSEHLSLLRQSLAPNILEAIKINQARYAVIKLFELGSVYLSFSGKFHTDNRQEKYLPHQEKRLILALASLQSDFELLSELKGSLENLILRLFGFNPEIIYEKVEISSSWAEPSLSANVIIENKSLGSINKLKEEVAKNLGIKKSVVLLEINFSAFWELLNLMPAKKYKALPKFPGLVRDLAFVLDNSVAYKEVKKELENFHEYIRSVELFDVYQGDKLGSDKKSLGFHLVYRHAERTLTAQEVDEIQSSLIKHLEDLYQAKIRNF
ncbi:MAG: phenylalanine--tRNA ligase subunit beta [Candidatus Pacebacteria bacterium]|nr:phenylalanine--tRNA ligase subunit beta [Candidatus Paceibacterota bacterium]